MQCIYYDSGCKPAVYRFWKDNDFYIIKRYLSKASAVDEQLILRNVKSPYIVELADVGIPKDTLEKTPSVSKWTVVNSLSIEEIRDLPETTTFATILKDAGYELDSCSRRGDLNKNFKEILLALRDLHQAKIVHCDLKPRNILLNKGHVRVCDFGNSFSAGLYFDEPLGTPYYAAPETLFIEGCYETAPSLDVWSFGCVIWNLVVDEIPFFNEVHHTLDKSGYFNQVKYMQKYSYELGEFQSLFLDCFQVNPKSRLSVDELLKKFF